MAGYFGADEILTYQGSSEADSEFFLTGEG